MKTHNFLLPPCLAFVLFIPFLVPSAETGTFLSVFIAHRNEKGQLRTDVLPNRATTFVGMPFQVPRDIDTLIPLMMLISYYQLLQKDQSMSESTKSKFASIWSSSISAEPSWERATPESWIVWFAYSTVPDSGLC